MRHDNGSDIVHIRSACIHALSLEAPITVTECDDVDGHHKYVNLINVFGCRIHDQC